MMNDNFATRNDMTTYARTMIDDMMTMTTDATTIDLMNNFLDELINDEYTTIYPTYATIDTPPADDLEYNSIADDEYTDLMITPARLAYALTIFIRDNA